MLGNPKRREAKLQAPRAEKGQEYFRLRVEGWTYQQIADKFGLNPSTVFEAVKRQLEKRNEAISEMVPIVRQEMTDRLDSAVRRVLEIMGGDDPEMALKAIDRLVKLEERRARLYGLDAPTPTVNVAVNGPMTEATPARALELIRQRFGLVGPSETEAVEAIGEPVG